jgi:hypothetical protein
MRQKSTISILFYKFLYAFLSGEISTSLKRRNREIIVFLSAKINITFREGWRFLRNCCWGDGKNA